MKKYTERKRLTVGHRDKYRERSVCLNAQQLSEILNVSEQTAYKWLSSQHSMEPAKQEILKIKALGVIPVPGWEGFFFDSRDNALVSRLGYALNCEEIEYFSLIKQLNVELGLRNKELKCRIEELEDQIEAGRPAEVVYLKERA